MWEGLGKAATPGQAGISTPSLCTSYWHVNALAQSCQLHVILFWGRWEQCWKWLSSKRYQLYSFYPPELFLALGLCSSYRTRGKHQFFRERRWEMPWLPIKWKHLSFGVYMAEEFSALQQCSALPGVFKGPWEASTANEGTLARSCITPCPAQHSCSSYHFLPLTTWLWLWTASTFCISQTNVWNVFICEGFTVWSAFAQGQGDFWFVWLCAVLWLCFISSYILLPSLLYLKH